MKLFVGYPRVSLRPYGSVVTLVRIWSIIVASYFFSDVSYFATKSIKSEGIGKMGKGLDKLPLQRGSTIDLELDISWALLATNL